MRYAVGLQAMGSQVLKGISYDDEVRRALTAAQGLNAHCSSSLIVLMIRGVD